MDGKVALGIAIGCGCLGLTLLLGLGAFWFLSFSSVEQAVVPPARVPVSRSATAQETRSITMPSIDAPATATDPLPAAGPETPRDAATME